MEKVASKFRYERKYVVRGHYQKQVELMVKLHPASFSEIFHIRHINNIYFDTADFKNYRDNIDGCADRTKVRIRWYGDLFGNIEKPVLEYKIKKGLLGRKESFRLVPFQLSNSFKIEDIRKVISDSEVPDRVKEEFKFLYPALLNRYKRKYFMSFDKKYRITIDDELEYNKIASHHNNFINKYKDSHSMIVELKYAAEADNTANNISTLFPFRMTKSSKYVNGVEHFYVDTI